MVEVHHCSDGSAGCVEDLTWVLEGGGLAVLMIPYQISGKRSDLMV